MTFSYDMSLEPAFDKPTYPGTGNGLGGEEGEYDVSLLCRIIEEAEQCKPSPTELLLIFVREGGCDWQRHGRLSMRSTQCQVRQKSTCTRESHQAGRFGAHIQPNAQGIVLHGLLIHGSSFFPKVCPL